MSEKRKPRCAVVQNNAKQPDFECKLEEGGHNIHVDPRTGTRWGAGPFPRGWNRRWGKKKYNQR